MKRKLLTFAITIFAAFGATANAQDTFYPGFQWGVKGGVGYTVGETSNFGKLISTVTMFSDFAGKIQQNFRQNGIFLKKFVNCEPV